MASLMENLIDTLGQESREYEQLLALTRKKTRIIASANLEDLKKITDDEQKIVSRISNLEKKRVEVTADIANVLNRDVTQLKLADLVDMMSGRAADQEKLAAVHDSLKVTVRELQRINEQNKTLLEDALEMVQFEMNLLQASKAAPETANYTRNAYNSGAQMGVSNGNFDAKQ